MNRTESLPVDGPDDAVEQGDYLVLVGPTRGNTTSTPHVGVAVPAD